MKRNIKENELFFYYMKYEADYVYLCNMYHIYKIDLLQPDLTRGILVDELFLKDEAEKYVREKNKIFYES